MRILFILPVVCALLMSGQRAFCQQRDTLSNGTAKGILRDVTDRHLLQAATASVYTVADSNLVSYRLTSNTGAFSFGKLPVATDLELVVTYVGYKSFRLRFAVPPDNRAVDLKYIDVSPATAELDEVKISGYKAPVQMKGDTLEFNADAFKTDPNAVVEDLMRRLPGVTLWGDGRITVNGKIVQQVLVDGKRFFGGNALVATQNIPKQAVDKVQVYSGSQKQKAADSSYHVNIKLKPGWKSGVFGKLAGGYGTSKRYSSDGIVNFFSPRTQLSLGGAVNNTNTVAGDINMLMRNSSFKGVGINVEYQPDFSMDGVHRPRSGGFYLQHDLKGELSKDESSRIEASYFIRDNLSNTRRNALTVNNISEGDDLFQNAVSSSSSSALSQVFKTDYRFKNDKINLYISPAFTQSRGHNNTLSEVSSLAESGSRLQSNSLSLNNRAEGDRSFSLRTGIQAERSGLQLDYSLLNAKKDLQMVNSTDFSSPLVPALSERFDRTYTNRSDQSVHDLTFSYNNLLRLLFGSQDPEKFSIGLFTSLRSASTFADNLVTDLDSTGRNHDLNSYLTNKNRYRTIDFVPGARLERSWSRKLSKRYDRTFTISAEIRGQFFRQSNVSEKVFQNFARSYTELLPATGISYSRGNGIDKRTTYKLNYNTSAAYPAIDQIAPLIDSTVIYYRQQGNFLLRQSRRSDVSFTLQHLSVASVNSNTQYQLTVTAGNIGHDISDSTIFDQLGRTVSYPVNVHGSRFLDIRAKYDQVYKIKDHQLQLTGNGSFNAARRPVYINTHRIGLGIQSVGADLSLLYTFKDRLALKIDQGITGLNTWQAGNESSRFQNLSQRTVLAGTVKCSGQLALSSNISLNRSSPSHAKELKFAIWNADIRYRFMPGSQCEVVLSALDLLHQNTGLINYVNNNSLTTGSVNVLQHYFLIGFAYFPRKFGFKRK